METKIQKQIIDFFSYFEEFYNSVKTKLSECHNYAVSINKLIIRCRHIKEAEVTSTPLEQFEGLQKKLSSALHNLISEEARLIQSNLSSIEEIFEKLCNKHKALHESCREVDFNQQTLLVKGTPLQPPLKQLLGFSEDIITFGSEICLQIETSLNVLAFRALKTESLANNFKVSNTWKRRISEIIAYTSFCPENEV